MKKLITIGIALLLLLTLAGCGNKPCDHNYQLTDISEDGGKLWVCKKCNDMYYEESSAGGHASDNGSIVLQPQEQPVEDVTNGFTKNSRSVRLFDLPLYSHDNGGVNTLDYASEVFDTQGFKHSDCYRVVASNTGANWLRYELDGKYTTLSGNIYRSEASMDAGVMWLEFYDGQDFLGSTGRLSDEKEEVTFEFDISGVDLLTVYPKRESYASGCWVICDQVTISK